MDESTPSFKVARGPLPGRKTPAEIREYRRQLKERGLCTSCACRPPRRPGMATCAFCLDKLKAKSANRTPGMCTQCDKLPAGENTNQCPRCLERARKHSYKIKDEVFAAYGGYECKCCGEKTVEFLQIDHIENNGAEHRKTLKRGSMYPWLKKNKFPPGYQVLCCNCNWAKSRYGACPHQRAANSSVTTT